MLMEVVLLWNLLKGPHAVAEVAAVMVVVVAHVSFLVEVRRQGQGGASIVGLMDIGLVTVKPVTGRTNAIDVVNVDILKGIVKIVPRK